MRITAMLLGIGLLLGFGHSRKPIQLIEPRYDAPVAACPYGYIGYSEFQPEGEKTYQHCSDCRVGVDIDGSCSHCGKKFNQVKHEQE